MTGGYDDGYRACPCFWGTKPGSMVRKLLARVPENLGGWTVLDAGCGEGKNARAFSKRRASVIGIECSDVALRNARNLSLDNRITWQHADIRSLRLPDEVFDIVIAYGLFHCLYTKEQIRETIRKLSRATKHGGYHVVCAFNDRNQDLSAHPGFTPCLLPHEFYVEQYAFWSLIELTDQDLYETHPHNSIPHTHSLTRLIAQRIDKCRARPS